MNIDINQLLTPTEAARLKEMKLNRFKYYVKTGSAPQPVLVGRFKHPFYDEGEIQAWNPKP